MSLGRRTLAAALAALCGCAVRDTVAVLGGGATDPLAYCQGGGPPVLADGTCTGDLTQRTFGRAACVCGSSSLGGDLVTDAFDSRVAPWVPGGAGGDVATDGTLSFNGLLQVGGSLLVAGGGLEAGSTLRVAGDLDVAGALGRPSSTATVGGSARVGGDVGVAALTVAGTLTTPPGATLGGTISAGNQVTAAVSVAAACPCGGRGIDVAGLVGRHRTASANASIGLAADALAAVSADATLELPCGRFYLDRISAGAAAVTLRIAGRTALFVGADLTVNGPFTVELAPGAELDLFVAGSLNLPGRFSVGDPARPGALRLWLASGGAVAVPAGSTLAANVYAPAADLVSNDPLDVFGAAVVGHLTSNAALSIHHDRAVAAAGAACVR